MATRDEFVSAFAAAEGSIIVQSRSGKQYYIHEDQLPLIPEGLIYGIPLIKHPRARGVAGEVVWMCPENVKIVSNTTTGA